jgi:hypothetical protein
MSIAAELVRNIMQTPFETFDADVVNRTKDRIIDLRRSESARLFDDP